MAQVPLKRTVITMGEFARALVKAWRHELGVLPTKQAGGIVWAQYMIETGGAACWSWNIGNLKVTQAQVDAGVDWHDLPGTWEIVNGVRVTLVAGDPGRRFRAYASLDDAMIEHLRFLRNRRYKVAWPAVEAGDYAEFARRLKAAGYFTASAEDYARGMKWPFDRWMVSTAYETATTETLAEMEAETQPELELPPSRRPPTIEDFAIVHPPVPLRGDPDPGDDAA